MTHPSNSRAALRKGAASGLLAILLAGCAAVPDLGPTPQVAAPSALESARSFQALQIAWPQDDWWKRYDDTQLDRLIAEALEHSPSLLVAAARVRAAEAATSSARANSLPQLYASGAFNETKASYYNGVSYAAVPKGVNDSASLRLNLDWNLDFFGRNRAAIAAALSSADAARAEAAQARLVLSTGVAAAYAQLLSQMRDTDLARETVAVRERTAALVERRRIEGLETLASAAQAQSALETARQTLAAQQEQQDIMRLGIAALLGAGPDRALTIERPAEPTLGTFGLPANLPADLVGRRPDVRAARYRVEARAAQVKQARAGFYPSINLSAFIGPQVLGLSQFFNDASLAGSAGPAINLPIFRGGALSATLRGARAGYDEAVASYDDTLVHALQDVAQTATSQRALAEQLQHARAARQSAETAYRAADARYRGGLYNYIAVLTAENTLIASRRAVSQLEARGFSLDIAMVRALGGGT
jgi:NodT family efflux transporter outer membrane factor (OMF) lipoprotein